MFDVLYSVQVMTDVFKAGYSRIPVYEKDRNDIVCVILTKDMLFVDTKVRNNYSEDIICAVNE